MIKILENNFVELLVMSALALLIVCVTVGVNIHYRLETDHEREMAKLGCVHKMNGAYLMWECVSKDK